MKQWAKTLKVDYSPATSRGELADKISERLEELWKERVQQMEGGERETTAGSGGRYSFTGPGRTTAYSRGWRRCLHIPALLLLCRRDRLMATVALSGSS